MLRLFQGLLFWPWIAMTTTKSITPEPGELT